MDDEQRYQKFLERDPIHNGKFLTGVLTTGIYCLPSCPARHPKRENIRFFKSPEEAARSGLRPCRRCHPDWFYRGAEWHENLFEQTAARVRKSPSDYADVRSIAAAAGLSRTALNDLFREHAHESPGAFLRRIRTEHVCRLLRQGEKPAIAAASAGFESTSALHEQFLARTGLTPGAYAGLAGMAEFTLRLPARYRSRELLDFYGRDPFSLSEQVSPGRLKKAVLIEGEPALLDISLTDARALCKVDAKDAFAAHHAIVRMLGLEWDAPGFERHFSNDSAFGALFQRQRGLRIPLTPDPWEALAWAIMGQQISLKLAAVLRRELIGEFGLAHASGLRAHPAAEAVAALDVEKLRTLKFSRSKAQYLIAAAQAAAGGALPLGTLRNLSATHAARLLEDVRGIGPWTVQYVFLRGFGFADCLPVQDAGLAQGLARLSGERPGEHGIREMMARFAPHRSLATYHVWSSLKGVESHAL